MNLIEKFITTMKNSDQALELARDGGEVALDAIMSDKFGVSGVLEKLPIMSMAISLYKAGSAISAHCFTKNMMAFLIELDSVPVSKRIEFLDKNCVDEEGIENVGEVTLMILDKLDSPKLATMLGRAFALLAIGTITRYEFDMYTHIIKATNPFLLKQLRSAYASDGVYAINQASATLLSNYGLMDTGLQLLNTEGGVELGLKMDKTALGKTFYNRIVVGSSTY